MLAEEYNLNYLSLLNCSCLQTEVTQKPTLHKHLIVSRHSLTICKDFYNFQAALAGQKACVVFKKFTAEILLKLKSEF